MKIRPLCFCAALVVAACGSAETVNSEASSEEGTSMESSLVAVEFSGSKRSLNRLAEAASELGWKVDNHSERSLRVLPPANYDPDQFGILLGRIEELGISDIGLRLIGPNGPVGPEG